MRFAPTDTSYVMAAWGLYGQQPQPADLSAAFGNPTLPTATGTHYVLGAGVSPVEPLTIDVTGFFTTSTGLAMRNASDQPARAEALVASGSGRTFGAQAQVRLAPVKGFYGWISYTLAWSHVDGDASFGSTLINYRYQLMFEGPGRPAFSPRISLILPTSNSDALDGPGLQCNLPFS